MRTLLAIVLLVVLPVSVVAQQPGATDPEAKAPRRTPLGTQVPKLPDQRPPVTSTGPKVPDSPQGPVEPLAGVLQRTAAEHSAAKLPTQRDLVAEGTLTYFGLGGPSVTFPVTLMQKDSDKVQRIVKQPAGDVRQGSNGKQTWNAFQAFMPAATGSPLYFIESQTSRSVRNVLLQKPGSVMRDSGVRGSDRVVEIEDQDKKKTSYALDSGTGRIRRLEFEVGEALNPFTGKTVPVTEAFEFSDFRVVDGVLTPFKIERFQSGIKTEEMQFNSVRYNTGVRDDQFRP